MQVTVSAAPTIRSKLVLAQVSFDTFGLLGSRRLPYTSSPSVSMVTGLLGSGAPFVMATVNWTVPPGSLTDVGLAVFATKSRAGGTGIGTLNPLSQRHFEGEPGKAWSGPLHGSLAPCRQLVQ